MENNEILLKLREKNPFASSASPLPWENVNPDLLQLSREASEEIEQLMRHKRREPSTPLAGLVLGEAGSGKTHMLTRILRRMRGNSRPAVFVAVKAFRDPETVTKHLLTEIFISLKRIHSSERTQFDIIMSEFAEAYKERRRQDGYSDAEISKLDLRTQLARDIPSFDRNLLKCLVTCLGTSDASIRNDVLDWLSDGLEDEDALRLGLPERDLSSFSDKRREQEAEKILIALGNILAYSNVSMTVCFDQMDAMKDRNLISAWGNVVSLLMNDLSGILPLCFVRSEIWNDVFIPVLDDAVVQRLRNNTMIMRTCSLEQARQLIKTKLEAVFKEDSEEIFNWLIARMGSSLRDGYSPRTVIELANHAVTANEQITATPDEKSVTPANENNKNKNNEDDEIFNAVKNVFEDEYKKVGKDPGIWPPDADHLAFALEFWLKSFDGFEFQKSSNKKMKLLGKYRDYDFAFVIVTSKNHVGAMSGLKLAKNFLEEHTEGFCCYVTEKKTHKSSWNKTNEAMQAFKNSGGHVLMLDAVTRIRWYALTALLNRIDNGDVNLYLASGHRAAVRNDIKNFVRSIKLVDFPFNVNEGKKDFEVQDSSEISVFNILSGILKVSPMQMLSVKKALEILNQRGIKITRNELISFLKREKFFRIYNFNSTDPIITLRKKD